MFAVGLVTRVFAISGALARGGGFHLVLTDVGFLSDLRIPISGGTSPHYVTSLTQRNIYSY